MHDVRCADSERNFFQSSSKSINFVSQFNVLINEPNFGSKGKFIKPYIFRHLFKIFKGHRELFSF